MAQNKYLNGLDFDNIHSVEKAYKRFLNRTIKNVEELDSWIKSYSELEDEILEVINKDFSAFQAYNDDMKIKNKFNRDVEKLMPIVKKYSAEINKFIYNNEFTKELNSDIYAHFLESVNNSINIFRNENIILEIEEDKICTEYSSILGDFIIHWNGNKRTLPQMYVYLENSNRDLRENAWEYMQSEKLKKADEIDDLMNRLIKIRHQKALNSGFNNFRDYAFRKYERFSYTPEDCFELHDSILEYVVPLKVEIEKKHKLALNVDVYRPWDAYASTEDENSLRPFDNIEELIDGTIRIFKKIDKEFAAHIGEIKSHGFLDIESRKGKSSGLFCKNLPISRLSYIFMNTTGTQQDLISLIHECGHAIHNMLSGNLELSKYKQLNMESAEFAALSMELLTMDKWDEFYKNKNELKHAKRKELEDILKFIPWTIGIDKFQHWMYLNPEHTPRERNAKFAEIAKEFYCPFSDWSSYENELENKWKFQSHIFIAPFFYIEYSISLIAAIQLWKNYKESPKVTLQNYKNALSLGNSKPLAEIYKTAGIKFDFSADTIKELTQFLWVELDKLS